MPDNPREPAVLRKHITELDGLRGLAVLLVMLHHFVLWRHQQAICRIDRFYAYFCETGWVGVEFFFVLSGFLITGILIDAKADRHYFRNFYARRALRIFPLYYLVLALLLVVFPHLGVGPVELRQGPAAPWSYWFYVSNFTLANEPAFSQPRLVTWSLAIEEQFYLLWPAVVWWVCGRRLLPRVAVAVWIGSIACRVWFWRIGLNPGLGFLWTPSHVDGLALGALVAVQVRQPGGLQRLARFGPAVGGIGLAGVVATAIFSFRRGLSMRQDPVGQILLYTAVALVGVALLIECLQSRGAAAVVFRTKVLRFLGKYSYGLYLYQSIVLAWIVYLGCYPVRPVWGSRLPDQMLFLAMNVGVTVGLAMLSFHAIEQPILRLKRFFPKSQSRMPRTY